MKDSQKAVHPPSLPYSKLNCFPQYVASTPDTVHAKIDELPRHMQINEKNKTKPFKGDPQKNAAS